MPTAWRCVFGWLILGLTTQPVVEVAMFKPKQVHLACSLFLVVSLATHAEASDGTTTETCRKITVQVSNLAAVPSATLARAHAETTRIFYEVGVVIEWEEYRVSRPVAGCPVRLIVSILPHATVFASGMALGSTGSFVHSLVFWDRNEELAQTSGSTDVILGHAMAHEICHLLMGPAHSQVGVMRPRWERGDIKMANRGHLKFTAAQAELLRGLVARRAN